MTPVSRVMSAVATAAMVAFTGAWLVPTSGQAQGPETAAKLYAGADLKLGEQLIKEHKCEACHIRREGGDGSTIYKPKGRINTPGFLRGMVEQCNTELNLGMFPEEVTAVAAVLNRDHYRFR